jgi:hypothetical protein
MSLNAKESQEESQDTHVFKCQSSGCPDLPDLPDRPDLLNAKAVGVLILLS